MQKKHRWWVPWLSLVVGVIITAAPFPMLFIPNNIAPGGITGLATLIHALSGLPVGLLALLLNAPLFMIGWQRLGRMFAFKSLLGTLAISFIIDLVPFPVLTHDPILASVFGGVLTGAGVGLVIRGGGSTGGTDMAATLIHERFPAITVGGLLLALDCCVIIASGFVFDIQSAMYALIAVFLTTQVVDRVIEGFASAKAFFVFSQHTKAIAQAVLENLGRGATLLHAQGAYRRQEGNVLLCVVTRLQVPAFKTLVKDMDPSAFVMVTDVREALGEGFTRPPAENTAQSAPTKDAP